MKDISRRGRKSVSGRVSRINEMEWGEEAINCGKHGPQTQDKREREKRLVRDGSLLKQKRCGTS